MSAPQLISPMLDGFVMGDPISSHDGVRSCPAVHLETEKKYIIKIISVPASQSKLDALLLAGAFSDRDSAEAYFKELADDVVNETEVLQNLAKHEGFIAFEDLQVVPMQEGETGYDIYLLGRYRSTLDGVLATNEMTHLQAINLGLDLCAALSAARRMGYIFTNLKPANIFLCNEREFRIGDLGFLRLDSLEFASLPDKYRSEYTPGEISDAYAALNATMDTYAVGLILYQAYNNGKLPIPGAPLEAPVHADPALAEIILKACAVDPAERWTDPVQMGQALATYMQSNPVNDVAIVPVSEVEETEPEEVFPDEDTQPSTEDILTEVDEALENAPPLIVSPAAEEVATEEEAAEEEETTEEIAEEPTEEQPDETPEEPDKEICEEVTEEIPEEDTPEEEQPQDEACETEETTEEAAESEPVPEESAEEVPAEDETAEILAQADDLIAHQLPEPPVAPEPFEVTLPEPEVEEPEEPAEQEEAEEETTDSPAEEEETVEICEEEPEVIDSDEEDQPAKPKNKRKGLIITAIVLAAILVLSCAGILFYQYFYLQTIEDMQLMGYEDQLTVQLTTDIADEKLTVKCTDTHGNALTAKVENGIAQFTGLRSGTTYSIEVKIDGFHKLLGDTSADYTTTAQTVITGFYAVTGPEDGSVILSFTPQGPNSEQWTVTCFTEGEVEKSVTFTGPVVTLNGLTVGKEYTFKLAPVTDLYLTGTDTITHTVSGLFYAQNLRITDFADGNLTLAWDDPAGVGVSKWYVRCYNDAGFDKTLTVEDTFVIFEDMDITAGYTFEVIADGMSLGTKINLAAGSILITNVTTDATDPTALNVSWEFEGSAPDGGWILQYTADGGLTQSIPCQTNSAVIKPLIPGTKYSISITPANGTTSFGGNLEYESPDAAAFSGFRVTAADMEFSMCKTPSKKYWTHKDVSEKNYTTSFQVGVSASFVMHVTSKTNQTQDVVTTLYVIRDAEGKVISANTESRTWDDMWDNRYGELTIPVMPENPGQYTVEIYFNAAAATTQAFEILAKN